MNDSRQLISFVFPVYNESAGIDKLYTETRPVLKKIKSTYDVEIIFINDGSKDNSLEKLTALHDKDKTIHIINFSRNFGHQIAVTAGLEFSHGDAVIVMDSDLQDPPKVALDLIKKWEEGFDVVYAQRRSRKDSFTKKLTAHVFYRLLDIVADIKIPKDTGDFRLIDRKVVEELKRFKEKNRYIRGLVSFIGFKQTGVLFDRSKRYAGKTNYTVAKMIKLALDAITSFSTTLLTLIIQIGLVFAGVGFLGLLFVGVNTLMQLNLISSVLIPFLSFGLFLAGIQITMLGIVGSYVGRIFAEVQNRPLYIIESVYSEREVSLSAKNEKNYDYQSKPQYAIS